MIVIIIIIIIINNFYFAYLRTMKLIANPDRA